MGAWGVPYVSHKLAGACCVGYCLSVKRSERVAWHGIAWHGGRDLLVTASILYIYLFKTEWFVQYNRLTLCDEFTVVWLGSVVSLPLG